LQTSQGYIIRILQHFATKLWNITNFVMLFQAVMKFFLDLFRSEFSLLRKWSIVFASRVKTALSDVFVLKGKHVADYILFSKDDLDKL
jgi:valyl-tRNA synthetase